MSTGIVLASQSPRRRALLAQVGVAFEAAATDIDESAEPGEAPLAYVERLARAKAAAGAARVGSERVVLGADTAVIADGAALGKPADEAEAQAMLAHLSGRPHTVASGVAVAFGACIEARVVTSEVTLRPTTAAERSAYWASGEPLGKAGAYAIQGLGAAFVEALSGSYSNVVGLPLFETLELIRGFGIDPLDPAQRASSWAPA
jgi:septum formation protein